MMPARAIFLLLVSVGATSAEPNSPEPLDCSRCNDAGAEFKYAECRSGGVCGKVAVNNPICSCEQCITCGDSKDDECIRNTNCLALSLELLTLIDKTGSAQQGQHLGKEILDIYTHIAHANTTVQSLDRLAAASELYGGVQSEGIFWDFERPVPAIGVSDQLQTATGLTAGEYSSQIAELQEAFPMPPFNQKTAIGWTLNHVQDYVSGRARAVFANSMRIMVLYTVGDTENTEDREGSQDYYSPRMQAFADKVNEAAVPTCVYVLRSEEEIDPSVGDAGKEQFKKIYHIMMGSFYDAINIRYAD
jgi:hypothetical protein